MLLFLTAEYVDNHVLSLKQFPDRRNFFGVSIPTGALFCKVQALKLFLFNEHILIYALKYVFIKKKVLLRSGFNMR